MTYLTQTGGEVCNVVFVHQVAGGGWGQSLLHPQPRICSPVRKVTNAIPCMDMQCNVIFDSVHFYLHEVNVASETIK